MQCSCSSSRPSSQCNKLSSQVRSVRTEWTDLVLVVEDEPTWKQQRLLQEHAPRWDKNVPFQHFFTWIIFLFVGTRGAERPQCQRSSIFTKMTHSLYSQKLSLLLLVVQSYTQFLLVCLQTRPISKLVLDQSNPLIKKGRVWYWWLIEEHGHKHGWSIVTNQDGCCCCKGL